MIKATIIKKIYFIWNFLIVTGVQSIINMAGSIVA